ncbi:SDR family NAD(P)-dependent oxidoreductase [Clostridium estertheticum]|uniref:SDR family NAD(P)-dependent oxidoreductase n=1 Tax=Clostridium estertheticum TaxID=238834 RepID=UPI001CCE026C|nr:SDR family NAD(P)-dependent oxidoreductase [Clostridium estertheticum]MBZ9609902.1 SDR family NAD(P)-dependent oxidoreductase [Clostridium estertheticum]
MNNSMIFVLSAKTEEQLRNYCENIKNFIEVHENLNLEDIMYTLQVGRGAMDYRLAFIVDKKEALLKKLKEFLSGNISEDILVSKVKRSRDAAVTSEKDEKALLQTWIKNKKYQEVAELWIKGLDIDWNQLYGDIKPRRIRLPTYPFAKERYWLPKDNSTRDMIKNTIIMEPIWKEQYITKNNITTEYTERIVIICELDGISKDDIKAYINRVDCINLEFEQEGSINERFESYAIQIFEKIQYILKLKPIGNVLVQIVISTQNQKQLFNGLSGILNTAQLENPKLVGQLIEVELHENIEEIIKKLEGNSLAPNDNRIRYKNNKRYIIEWDEVIASQSKIQLPWREKGVYLITGGGGRLGLIFAEEISKKTKNVVLILIGRSQLNKESQHKLKEFESLGATVVYKQVDVGQKEAVCSLIKQIIEDYGYLNGIIHTAGVIKDNFIIKKTRKEIREVFSPKVTGVVNLDKASQKLSLDFFILFSSGAGAFGNIGQADYSMANAFMDSYAKYRNDLVAVGKRQGRTVSVNWPLWKDGGMYVDVETEKTFLSMGMTAMKTSNGIQAFYEGVSLGKDQIMVIEGNRTKILQQLSCVDFKTYLRPVKEIDVKGDTKQLKEKMIQMLKGLIGEVTKLSIDKIDSFEQLEKYGINSIMIIQLNEKLDNVFDELSKTLFYEHQTIDDLAEYVIVNHPQECIKWTEIEEQIKETLKNISTPISISSKDSLPMKEKETSVYDSTSSNLGDKANEAIAIIGVSGRYPKAENIQEYWKNLKDGKDCISKIPIERWSLEGFYNSDPQMAVQQNKSYSKWGGFISSYSDFDPLFFNISPREAINMDPQERLFIESCWELIEDAGYTRQQLEDKFNNQVGVFVGVTKTGYELYGSELLKQGKKVYPHISFSSVANRISYLFNLQGPSMPIDTMCSSSLTAIHEACEHLHRGECEMAIAGGVNLYLHPSNYIELCRQKMLSVDGQCKSFGKGGNGFVPGEGVGSILLKPLSRAIADDDHIYATIRSTSINHGGKTNGYTVPNPIAQRTLICKALNKSGVNARTISYIEAHGTGTELGDPIEISGITQAFQGYTQDIGFCSIGSVKSNIGHLEAAAGIAGVTKILLQMKHKMIVPSLHAKELNPNINFEKTPFVVQQELSEWKRPVIEKNGIAKEYPRRAGISAFGAGGANAHVLIEEYDYKKQEQSQVISIDQNPIVIVLSARNEERLKAQVKQLLIFIEEKQFTHSTLLDIAYTLQVGREAMKCRLGLIVKSVGELKEKMSKYIEGKKNIQGMCSGQVKRSKEELFTFAEDEDMKNALDGWITKEKYANLLSLWIKGISFDWNKIYKGIRPHRISLPTYPFIKERYWIPETDSKYVCDSNTPGLSMHTIHPLLHKNISNLSEQRYSSTFIGKEFFLSDHVVKGQKTFPGVAYLEMVRAAIEQATGMEKDDWGKVHLKNVVWIKPITVDDRPVRVDISLFPEDNGEITYEVYGEPFESDMDAVVHCQGSVILSDNGEAPILNVEELQKQCSQRTISSNQCYGMFKEVGINYGLGHQGIKEIYVGQDQVLAKLYLPSSVNSTKDNYVLHPSIMDSALQASACLMLNFNKNKLILPFALQELTIFNKCTSSMWAFIRNSKDNKTDDKVQKLDIDLCDNQGKVCVTMRNVSFRILESKTSMTEMITDTETLIFRPVWKDQAIVKKDKPLKYTNHIVILCGGGTELKDTIETCIEGVLCISLELRKESRGEQFQIYTLQIFDKIQKIIKDKPKGNILIQVMVFSQAEQNLFAGLSGLLRTAKLENSKLIGQLIEIEAVEDRKNIIKILLENSHCPMNDQIRYKDNKRYISTWNEIKTSEDTSPLTKTWKDGGVYLITGGTGGLGLIFAREIAEKTQGCTLILVGRSPIDEDKQAQLKELKKLGATVDYKQTDISKKEDVYKLIKGIREERGIINGIIHSAGIIEDNFIIKKTKEEIVRVMSPKVLGLVNLDESTREFKLDFFILFSSIAGVIGNVGQADYSAANAFMDVYARYRNALVTEGQCYGHTLSINWPMWKEGGMHINKESEKMMIHNMGIIAMKTQSGINAFNQTLTLETDQVMVIEGDRQKVKQKLLSIIEPKVSTLEEVSGKSNTYIEIDKENLLNKIQGILKHIVSQILKVKIEDLYTDNELSEYGFDSITLTEFANRINHSYKLDLTPTIFFEYPTLHDFAEYLVREQASSFDTGFITQCKEKPLVISQKNENRDKKDIFNKRQHYRFAKGVMSSQANLENTISDDPIAIIGMSGVFPMANDVEELWGNLVDGRDCITEIPKDRWDWTKYYGDPIKEINKTNIKWGGFIDGIGDFDPLFFGISPREAVLMDPQQRLLMIYAWKVIEDAGYSAKSISGTNTGIFVGTGSSGYNGLIEKANIAIEGYSATGVVPSIGPNRMSYLLNIHGPSEPIETACSSSLVAIHHAVSAIKSGNCDMAIVGGVNSIVTPEAHISFSKAGMLCEDGRCKTFSDKANGYVRGEGAGMLFLKKLKAAEKDGDHIYGLLRGSSENHGGRANSLTAPNPKAQVELLKSAYYKAGIDPRTVTYIETHGTGTELGDPIEINGLKTAFKELYQTTRCPQIENSYCGLGSIKTNIGHLELAAGIAGVIKVLLQMKHKTLVKNLHCDTINPYIELKDSPFYIVTENKEWKPVKDDLGNKLPLRAGISAFGFGGVNAHVVIEEYVPQVQNHPQVSVTSQNPAIIVLSAKNEDRLKVKAQNLLEAIQKQKFSDTDLDKIAYTLQVGREAMEERLGFTAESIKKLEEKLKWFLENKSTNEDLFRGQCNHNREELAFLSTDEEMQEALGKWIQRKKYAKLLELWVKGVNLDWNKLYGENKPHRISLPSYPFTKERYWVSKTKEKIGITASRVPPNKEQSAPYRTCEKPKDISLVPLPANKILQSGQMIKVAKTSRMPHDIESNSDHQTILNIQTNLEMESIRKELITSLAKVLGMEYSEIDINDNFVDLGVDSIIGVEWIQVINKQYDTTIAKTNVYEYPTIEKFAGFLKKEVTKSPLLHEMIQQVQQGTLDAEQAEKLFYNYDL